MQSGSMSRPGSSPTTSWACRPQGSPYARRRAIAGRPIVTAALYWSGQESGHLGRLRGSIKEDAPEGHRAIPGRGPDTAAMPAAEAGTRSYRRVARFVKSGAHALSVAVCGINRDVSGNDNEMSRFGDTNVTGGPGGQTWVRVPSSPPIPLIRVSIHLGLAIQDSYRDSYS